MKKTIIPFIALSIALLSPALAQDRGAHHEGKAAPTLTVALANLKESSAKLAEILGKEKVTPADLNQIHILSYTLENALAKLSEEQKRLAELCEEVHVASEKNDAKTVKASGKAFLEAVGPLVK
jgi:hypothetical protein